MPKWPERILMPNEKIIRRGGNQTGRYVIICSSYHHYRVWDDFGPKQRNIGKCTCPEWIETGLDN